jgi:hypothetical protein
MKGKNCQMSFSERISERKIVAGMIVLQNADMQMSTPELRARNSEFRIQQPGEVTRKSRRHNSESPNPCNKNSTCQSQSQEIIFL